MKTKLVAVAFISHFLTGCLSTAIDLSSSHDYQSKWSGQCLVLMQDVELWQGSTTHSFSSNFLKDKISTRIPGKLNREDVITKGIQLKVIDVYDTYIHGSRGDWHLRVNLKILEGTYRGLEVEIPGIFPDHPKPLFFSHSTQKIPFAARESLQPNSIEFNPDFLTACP